MKFRSVVHIWEVHSKAVYVRMCNICFTVIIIIIIISASAITIAKDRWINCTHSSGKLWCHCAQWDLARHPKKNKNPLAEVAIHAYKVFRVDKPTPPGRGGGSIIYVKNTLNPLESKSLGIYTREIIQVDINTKNAVHLKFVLIYRNTKSQQLMMMSSLLECWNKFY